MEKTFLTKKSAMILIPPASIPSRIKRVVSWVFSPKVVLIILLGIVFITFVAVMANKSAEGYISQLLDLPGKNEILTFLGLSMGGILLALQAVIANTRATAMEDAAVEQTKANENMEKGQRQERLKNAIEHLGHASVSIRLGGAYELFHLAQDTEELRQTILDILCSHIRRTTGEDDYQDNHKSKPSEEIQSLLTLLFVQEHEIFKGLHINLQGSCLNGADLNKARLERAVLMGANLHRTYLISAQLQRVSLGLAKLQGAYLIQAQLQGAYLYYAEMQGADLFDAKLLGADLHRAKLQGSDLGFAKMQGVDLRDTQLQGSHLSEVGLQGANLFNANFQGVTSGSDGSYSFETRVKDCIGEDGDLSRVIFAGGLSQENLDSIVKGLPEYATSELRTKLIPHIGQEPSHKLPDNSGAITGSYTKKEAEKWITEYNQATSAVSKDKDR